MNNVAGFGNLLVRAVNRYGSFLATSRLKAVDLDLGRLLNEATERAGLDDFGGTAFIPPLCVLLEAKSLAFRRRSGSQCHW